MNKFRKISLLVLLYFAIFISFDIALGKIYKIPWVLGYAEHPNGDTYLRPGSSGWFTREGESFVNVNNIGSNDVKDRYVKSNGVFRIAVIGDSYVEALQVPATNSFWHLLETELNEKCTRPGETYELVPLGVSGHGPVQYLNTLRTRAKDLDVDLSIVLFTTGNYIRNTSPELEFGSSGGSAFLSKTFLSISDDGSATIDRITDLSVQSRLHKYISANINLIEQSNFLKLAYEFSARIKNLRTTQQSNSNKPSDLYNDNSIYLPDQRLTESWRNAKFLTEKVIELIGDYNKIKPVVAVIGTNPSQVLPDLKKIEEISADLNVADLKEPNRFFSEILEKNQVPYIDLLKFLKINGEGIHGEAPNWGGHWNRNGHKLVSIVLSQEMCPILKNLE